MPNRAKRRWILLAAAMLLGPTVAAASAATVGERAFAAVDPFIGTAGEGHTYPGATVPFGMVQLSPDTRIQPREKAYDWAAGYRHDDTSIVGFSHTHFSGSGHSDLGDVLLMPYTGEPGLERGDPDKPRSGYASRFSHRDERAEPGYYAVTLDDHRVRAELTASERVGVHRYRFPAGEQAKVLLDLRTSLYDYPGKILWSRLRVHEDGTVTGFRETRGWAPGRQLYFAMRFSRPLTGHALHNTETDIAYKGFPPPGHGSPLQRAQVEGRQLVATFDFGKLDAPLVVKVAISSVSEAGAIANLDAEVPAFDFDRVRADAKKKWMDALAVVDIEAPLPDRRSAYTALYHSMLEPTLTSDVDVRYLGADGKPDRLTKGQEAQYGTFSGWDQYR
ncbi:MAG: glycoside hydrolase family 92 protein, partial [Stenotrophomonas sp.]|nr:glycoside hydrolase family 92 protein [Stenotrophomonas sp.]